MTPSFPASSPLVKGRLCVRLSRDPAAAIHILRSDKTRTRCGLPVPPGLMLIPSTLIEAGTLCRNCLRSVHQMKGGRLDEP